jgi:hypothetical protein
MGSHPTLDHQQLAADHSQVRAWRDDNPDLAHHLDHRDWIYDHSHPSRERAAEQAFDRRNPGLRAARRPA